jgi:hypothetical protein
LFSKNPLPVPNVYNYVVVYHMQSQFIAKNNKSHLVTRKKQNKSQLVAEEYSSGPTFVKSLPQPYCADAYFSKKTLSATPRPLLLES